MPISARPAFQDALGRALQAYLQDPLSIGLTSDLAILARTHIAPPVYADMGGALLMRSTGEVLLVHSNQEWTVSSEWSLVTEAQLLDVAYAACQSRYPTLREFLPSVPALDTLRHLTSGSSDRVTDFINALLEFKPSDDEIENVDTLEIFDGFGDFPDGVRAVPAMLSILERYPKAEFGNPGPIVHELEKIDDRVALRESFIGSPPYRQFG